MLRTIIKYIVKWLVFIGVALFIHLKFSIDNVYMIIGVLAFIGVLHHQNESIKVTEYDISHDKYPGNHGELRIMQISDFHNKRYGKAQKRLEKKIRDIEIDIIVITGDTIDEKYDKNSRHLVEVLIKKAPVYFITGNHEFDTCPISYGNFEKFLEEKGVHVLRNKAKKVGDISIIGIDDHDLEGKEKFLERLEVLSKEDGFKILLSHRPEFAEEYIKNNYEIVFSGHAHGGQVRVPKVGALAAPGQKIFPKYAEGFIDEGNTKLVISRGLGDSLVPQRLFNRPEIVIANIKG
ncbi:MAG: metallophosphoesterase [Clostridia bacterium]|jgi:predicted MPP superfamily phosphohydrolase|nr:metallophosphoesterase [Clostridia bacterium]